jgi:hypothetical protein
MITLEQQKKGEELMQTLVQKAWESASFKEQLVNNTDTTIETIIGKKVDVKFFVEDQSNESIIYLNIPRKVELTEIELSDEQLELVSGGEVAASAGLALACIGLFAAGVSIGLAIK